MGSNWLDLNDNLNAQIGVVSTLFLAVLALLWLRRGSKANPPLPPGPRGFPIVGYLPFLAGDLHRQFTQLSTLYGPIYKLWLGGQLCVVVNSPSLVKEVVRDKDVIFANRDPIIAIMVATYGGRDIVLSPYGPEWKKMRKIFVREMLSNTILDNLYSLRREEVKKSIKNVYEKIGEEIDIGDLGFVTVINAVMSMLWGGKLEGENVAIVDGVEFKRAAGKLMVLFGRPNVSDFFPAIAWLDLQGIERETREIKDLFEVMFDSAIEKRRKLNNMEETRDGDERKDFLQFLLELHDAEMSITTDQLKALLMDTVVGGTDTTTTVVEWTMAELLKHPKVMKKVQEELTRVVGLNKTIEEFHLSQLTYLNAAIKETFRLHPTLPFLVPRCPSQSATIGGFHVPKGTRVFLNVWAIQRDPSIWEDPLEFRPERFLNDPNKYDYSGNNFHFFPFGSGRRLCAGLPLAERMMVYILASFLHSFDWKLPPGGKLELSDRFGIVTKKSEPLIAIPTPRLSNLELYR
ncbi:hypothetical protein UlMin_044522 [Ulmus minor]